MEVIEAHGGAPYWNQLDKIEAEISASGFLFTTKRRPILDHVRVHAYAHEPRFTFFDFPLKGQESNFIGDNEVNIKDRDGRVIASRERPRMAFRGLRRQFFWDNLDFIYFGGYATWNYLTAPFLFLRPGFEFKMLEPLAGQYIPSSRLQVTFPEDIPTHSKHQIFYFDENRLLQRLDYTALVVGRWARAAHLCYDYRDFGHIKAPTRRRVRPLFFGKEPLPWPTLVSLDIHDMKLIPIASAS
jgi:hypothetical protein